MRGAELLGSVRVAVLAVWLLYTPHALSRVLGRHDKNFVFKIAKRHDELFPDKPLKRRFEKSLKGDFRAACLGICFGANESDLSGVGEAAAGE